MMLKYLNLVSLFILGINFVQCHDAAQEKFSETEFNQMADEVSQGSVPDISVDQLHKAKASFILLDCREKAEFAISHLEGARWVGFDDFDLLRVKDLPKNTKIVTYCTVGWRSERIGEKLQKAGYTQVQNLHGSIFKWMNEGYPVVDQQGKTTKQVHVYSSKYRKYAKSKEVVY
ncbi:MAG: rhodanese-like domain-containing protein [Microscillaceae bacterium]|nr:rhodanese-like domain-containing protein [Microscillaceae bacterium]